MENKITRKKTRCDKYNIFNNGILLGTVYKKWLGYRNYTTWKIVGKDENFSTMKKTIEYLIR